jgi:hypothetical protein
MIITVQHVRQMSWHSQFSRTAAGYGKFGPNNWRGDFDEECSNRSAQISRAGAPGEGFLQEKN